MIEVLNVLTYRFCYSFFLFYWYLILSTGSHMLSPNISFIKSLIFFNWFIIDFSDYNTTTKLPREFYWIEFFLSCWISFCALKFHNLFLNNFRLFSELEKSSFLYNKTIYEVRSNLVSFLYFLSHFSWHYFIFDFLPVFL